MLKPENLYLTQEHRAVKELSDELLVQGDTTLTQVTYHIHTDVEEVLHTLNDSPLSGIMLPPDASLYNEQEKIPDERGSFVVQDAQPEILALRVSGIDGSESGPAISRDSPVKNPDDWRRTLQIIFWFSRFEKDFPEAREEISLEAYSAAPLMTISRNALDPAYGGDRGAVHSIVNWGNPTPRQINAFLDITRVLASQRANETQT